MRYFFTILRKYGPDKISSYKNYKLHTRHNIMQKKFRCTCSTLVRPYSSQCNGRAILIKNSEALAEDFYRNIVQMDGKIYCDKLLTVFNCVVKKFMWLLCIN